MGHDGSILGYNNFVLSLPQRDATIIVIVNKCDDEGQDDSAASLFLNVVKALYPDQVPW